MRVVLLIGGLFNLLFAVFHAVMPQMSQWDAGLGSLSADYLSLMYIFNYIVMYVLLVFAYVSIFQWRSLCSTGLGKAISAAILGFWLVRAAEGVIFSGVAQPGAWTLIVLCLAIGALYLVPVVLGGAGGREPTARRAEAR